MREREREREREMSDGYLIIIIIKGSTQPNPRGSSWPHGLDNYFLINNNNNKLSIRTSPLQIRANL